MRLLITTDTVGGVWSFTKELAAGCVDRGHEVLLVSFGGVPSADQQSGMERLAQKGDGQFRFEATDVPLEWMQENSHAYTAGADFLLPRIGEFSPDALLLNQFCFGALPIDVPKIVAGHSDVLSWAAACDEQLDEESKWLKTYRKLVQDGLDGADAVVAPTAASLEELGRSFSLPDSQHVIANGRAIPQVRGGARKLQAVSAGRLWDKAKNLLLLSQVDAPMPILVAGESSVNECGKLHLLGRRSETELLQLFRESAVYLCPSVYEPFGLAPLEAAMCGCAVACMDIPSLREVWGDGAVYFRDAASLEAVLKRLHDDPEALRQAQHASRQRAARYSADRMTDAYLDLAVRTIEKASCAVAA